MEELQKAIFKLAGGQSPRLIAQRDGTESTISSIELDATGSARSIPVTANDFPRVPPPRHPARSHADYLRFPATTQRSFSGRTNDTSPTASCPTAQPYDSTRLSPSFSPYHSRPVELPGSVPSEASSAHRLSSDSDVLGFDQPSIREQLNSASTDGAPRPWDPSNQPTHHASGRNIDSGEAFPERVAPGSMYTASSAPSIAHPWPPESAASSVHRHGSTSTYGERPGVADLPIRSRSLRSPHLDRASSRSESSIGSYDDENVEGSNKRGIATVAQQKQFESSAFRNTAVLCDV